MSGTPEAESRLTAWFQGSTQALPPEVVRDLREVLAGLRRLRGAVLGEREACAARLEELADAWESGPFPDDTEVSPVRRRDYGYVLRNAALALRNRGEP